MALAGAACGCLCFEDATRTYATGADAPEWLGAPAEAVDVIETHNLDTNWVIARFRFTTLDGLEAYRRELEAAPAPSRICEPHCGFWWRDEGFPSSAPPAGRSWFHRPGDARVLITIDESTLTSHLFSCGS